MPQENSTSLNSQKGEHPEKEPFCDFELPDEDYWSLLFASRLAAERPSSPPLLTHQLEPVSSVPRRRQSVVDDTDGSAPSIFVVACD